MKKIFELGWINKGDSFKFKNIDNFKDTYVKRNSDCSTIIGGMMRNNSNEPWRAINEGFSVSNKAEVYLLD